MLELQNDFLVGFLAPFLCEVHCPLLSLRNPRPQDDNIPQELIIEERPRESPLRVASIRSRGAPAKRSVAEGVVEAITGRIIPTDHEPGAIEAGCVNFIDKALAHGDVAMAPLYRTGLAGVDAVSRQRFAKPSAELAAEQQDEVLTALESGNAGGWPAGSELLASRFFEALRAHTIIGFLADPKYGGNRDYAGWKVTGYPGGGHHLGGYSPAQMMGKEKIKTAWDEEV